MATHTLAADRTTTWKVTGSNGTWIVKDGVDIKTAGQSGISEGASSHDNKIVINGSVGAYGPLFPIALSPVKVMGTNTQVTVADTATITGTAAILGIDGGAGTLANNLSVINHGHINASYYGILGGKNTHVDNDGRITGFYGVAVNAGDAVVMNRADGIINTQGVGVAALGATSLKVTNHGLIIGEGAVYASDGAKLDLVNDGRIIGNVLGNTANDRMDMRGGSLDGELRGDKGNDTYIVDKSTYVVKELVGEGVDTLKSTVSNTLAANVDKLVLIGTGNISGKGNSDGNSLTGNSGNNKLSGLAGNDRLAGGKGTDMLTGGADADHFIFHKGDQTDTIIDFQNGTDKIDILGFGSAINDFGDLSGKITQVNGDVQINLGGGDKLLIKTALVADFDATDFLFT